MTLKAERTAEIVRLLQKMYPRAKCSLDFETPLQLLVATILSAQSTDARVNLVTKTLFKKYGSAEAFARAKTDVFERDIKSTGFFRSKTKSVQGAARTIVETHNGQVPQTMEQLTALPGVGRKTANVVLGNAFGKPAGIVVDTHISRVSGRLALTRQSNPEKIEADLMKLVPQKEWIRFSHRMILHGRQICVARKPKCSQCLLNELCPSAEEPLE